MLSANIKRVAIIAAAALAATAQNATDHKQAVFVSSGQDLAFGLTVPNDSSSDIYFTLAVQQSLTWGAIGLGSDQMAGALVLVVYANAKGDNVTLSPRLATKHAEPTHYPDLQVETLAGTGIVGGNLVFRGRCANCRSFPGGSLDAASPAQKFIYAIGASGAASDDAAAPLKFHAEYGSFTVDMPAATGPAGAPVLDKQTTQANSGVAPGAVQSGKREWASVIHAVAMVFCFIGLLPLGVLIIRLGEWVRWHALNQLLALIGILVGFSLGIYISPLYNRSKSFNTPHQVIGILVVIMILAQFFLGVFHHRIYKKNKQPTKLAPFHVWLGRLVIPLGIINAFLGFRFALSNFYNYILAGLVIAIVPIMAFLLIGKNLIRKRLQRSKNKPSAAAGPDTGYDPEPWRTATDQQQQQQQENPHSRGWSGGGGGGGPYAYDSAGGLNISMTDLTHDGTARKDRTRTRAAPVDLGAVQTPREYV